MIRESVLRDLPPAERALFQEFGAGPIRTPPFDHVHHAFERHAERRPHVTAVEHLGESLTYGELDARASLLAELLVRRGVRHGDHVGLFLSRSISMVVGILATLKAGATYVPQDPRTASERHLRHVVRTARIDVVLTRRADTLPEHLATVVTVDDLPDVRSFSRTITPDAEIAAVIFGSGAGVRVSHANLCNLLLTAPGSLGVTTGTRVTHLLDVDSGLAMWEVLGTLANGGTLVIRGDDAGLAASTAEVVIATPRVLASLDPDACRRVHTVAVAGDPCPRELADLWSRRAVFHNAGGRTEAGIVNTVQRYEPRVGTLTVGRPLPNTTTYVLDREQHPRPIGAVGEMWAGGACVTAGYLGNGDLTAERFRPDPFLGGDHLMFRTRELGRWTTDGELERVVGPPVGVTAHPHRRGISRVSSSA